MIELRNANKDDINSILTIENKCFLAPFTYNELLYEISKNEVSQTYVVEDCGAILGFCIYWITFDSATIVQIAVDPLYQRKGLAKMMMKEVIKDCYAERVRTITLEVRQNNISAQKLYKSVGFEEILIKERYYSNGDNAIYMIRKVDIVNGNNTCN